MNERHLLSFVRAAERGSLSKAAADLYMTPAAISQQITALEKSMGFALFERSSSGVTLTPAGMVFCETAKKILTSLEESRRLGQAIELGLDAPRLRLAIEQCEVARYLTPLLASYQAECPKVDVTLVQLQLEEFPDALASGDVDVYFAAESLPRGEGAQFYPMYRDVYTCCMSPGHRLASRTSLSVDDLVGEQVYMLESECAPGKPLEALASALGNGNVNTTPFSISLPTTVGLGDGILMRFSECALSCVPPLVCVPFDGSGQWLGACCRPPLLPQLNRFIDVARRFFRTRFAPGSWRTSNEAQGSL